MPLEPNWTVFAKFGGKFVGDFGGDFGGNIFQFGIVSPTQLWGNISSPFFEVLKTRSEGFETGRFPIRIVNIPIREKADVGEFDIFDQIQNRKIFLQFPFFLDELVVA
jgi:hypothetical protein